MKGLMVALDVMGRDTEAVAPSDSVLIIFLTAGAAKSVTVPDRARVVSINATGDVFVRFGDVAALPTADILDGSAPELNPGSRRVDAGSRIGLIAPVDCLVNLAFYG